MADITEIKLPDATVFTVKDPNAQPKTLATPLTINGNTESTVEGALGGLNDYSDALKGAISNENLLDNPWFTVNQRGLSTYSGGSQYTADRWKYDYAGSTSSVDVSSSGITINNTNTYTFIEQKFESVSNILNRPLTASILFSDGTIKSGTAIFDGTTSINFLPTTEDVRLQMNYLNNSFRVVSYSSSPVSIRAVKLELGTVSTLANDVEPNYAFELAKCRASTADPSDTYANKGNLVNYADLTSLYLTGSTNSTGSTINKNTYFYLNGSYCKAKTSIANGATFTLNTNFEVITVGGVLSALNEKLANTFGAVVNILSYNSISNMYTCPNDGYIVLIADGAANSYTQAKNSNNDIIATAKTPTANQSFWVTISVRKGMQFYIVNTDAACAARYYPLT